MVSEQFLFVLLVLCGVSLHAVQSQSDQSIGDSSFDDSGYNEANEIITDHFDDNDDVMTRLNAVESIDDFVSLMQRNGRPVAINDSIATPQVNGDGKLEISLGRLAVPDNCAPRNTTIRILLEGTDSETAFFPRCTKIERCGGCCSSPHLECVPRYKERVMLKVLKGKIPFPGATHLEYNGFAPVIVERHVACRISCKLNQELCGPKKNFNPRKCTCACKTKLACDPPYVWKTEDCACRCPVIAQCCANGESCGMVFNPITCECVLNNNNIVSISLDRPSNISGVRALPPATTTTTTMATTTLPPNPCRDHICPPRFAKVPRGSLCLCRPMNFGGRRRIRLRG